MTQRSRSAPWEIFTACDRLDPASPDTTCRAGHCSSRPRTPGSPPRSPARRRGTPAPWEPASRTCRSWSAGCAASLWCSSGSSRSPSSSAQSSSAWIFSRTPRATSLYTRFLRRQRKQKETWAQTRAPAASSDPAGALEEGAESPRGRAAATSRSHEPQRHSSLCCQSFPGTRETAAPALFLLTEDEASLDTSAQSGATPLLGRGRNGIRAAAQAGL